MREPTSDSWPLSAAQTSIWFAQQLDTRSPNFQRGEYVEIRGALDVALLAEATRRCVLATDALWARFVQHGESVRQVVSVPADWTMPVVDVSGGPDPETAARQRIERDFYQAVDLAGDTLFHFALYVLGEDHYFWYIRAHHIVVDGFSEALVLERIGELYAALESGQPAGESVFASSAVLVRDDEEYRSSEQFRLDREFWLHDAANGTEPRGFSQRTERPARELLRVTSALSLEESDRIRAVARESRVTWSGLALAITAAFVARVTGSADVVLGLPVAARKGALVRRTPGMTANVVPLRLSVPAWLSFADLVGQVAKQTRAVLRHQRYRAEDIRRDLALPRESRLYGPVVNVMAAQGDTFCGLPATVHRLANGAEDDLSILIYGGGPGSVVEIDFDANPVLHDEASVRLSQQRFVRFLREVLRRDPALPIGLVDLLDEREHAYLSEIMTGARIAPASEIVPDLLAAGVLSGTEEPVVVSGTDQVTRAHLDRAANRLARALVARGIGAESIVAVALPRSADMVVALLAVLKAGAAYLPIDLTYPAERIAFMLADAAPALVLTSAGGLPDIAHDVMLLDHPDVAAEVFSYSSTHVTDADRRTPLLPQHPAYVVYTSGSTGRPKGTIIDHRAMADYLAWCVRSYPAMRGSTLVHSSISFDLTVTGLFGTLAAGGQVVLAPLEHGALAGGSPRPTFLKGTPSHVGILAELPPEFSPTGTLLLGGELLLGEALASWRAENPGATVINVYGHTETTVNCAEYRVQPGAELPAGAIPFGRPFDNTRMYLLDAGLRPVPPGIPGEVYVSGPAVARGYLNRPGLTASRFVADPFGAPGERMYRSGDLARMRADGLMEFVGRGDDQVKIRGHRIELGEINSVLSGHSRVRTSAVIVRDDRILAYLVGDADHDELRGYLARTLPEHMIPSAFVTLDELPLTANGKLDRRALPVPSAERSGGEPETETERLLCALFAEVLGLAEVGTADNFFALGGHSLIAMRLVSRIRAALSAEIGVRTVFDQPTPRALGAALAGRSAAGRPVLAPRDRPEHVPLSYSQRRLWALSKLHGPNPTYNLAATLRLRGELDIPALTAAVADLVERHETLRTVFPEFDGEPAQVVLRDAAPEIAVIPCVASAVEDMVRVVARRPFDIAVEPPLRVGLLSLAPDDHVLVVVIHHIATDGWTSVTLVRDIGRAYRARRHGVEANWAPLPVQYSDYALWQRELLSQHGGPAERQTAYWQEALAGMPDQLELPTDRPRPAVPSHQGERVAFRIEPGLHRRLAELATAENASLFMVLQASLAALFTRLGAGTDIPLGSPVAGRTEVELEGLVGLFTNMVTLRADTSGDPSFRELLGRVRDRSLAVYANQDLPFERVVEVVNPRRSLSRHPLFQVMLVLQNTPDLVAEFGDLAAEISFHGNGTARFDLTVSLDEHRTGDTPAGLDGVIEYATDLFDHGTVVALAERLTRFLAAVSHSVEQRIGDIDILGPAERELILGARSDTPVERGTLAALFEAQVRATPDAVAVEFGDTTLTYAQLNERANRLAHRLISLGIGPEQTVAVSLAPSIELAEALLAVVKAGAAYLPIDPGYPADRIAFTLKDAQVALVVDTPQEADGYPADNPVVPVSLSNAAYVIYTSGSTGLPKGVVVPHHGIANVAVAQRNLLGLAPGSRVLQFFSASFDASLWEMVMALLSGATLVFAPRAQTMPGQPLLDTLAARGITHLTSTPAVLSVLSERSLPDLVIVVGGEALSAELVARWSTVRMFVNAYGPTENTLCASMSEPLTAADSHAPIGTPIPNTRMYVLDSKMRLVPTGVTGELYLAGDNVARGYLNQPGLTAQRFVANPFTPGARLYRTGDLVRRNASGQLEFVGRADDQVKIRGFRVELGEIEAVLRDQPGVRHSAVVVTDDGRLAAYVVADTDISALRGRLAAVLPGHMVPSAFVTLDELPLTTNGKLDRRALPAPEAAGTSSREPRTAREQVVCELFAEVLGRDAVGVDDDFFELGGHSLLATRLVDRLRTVLGVDLPLAEFFERPTVAGLEARLDNAQAAVPSLVPRHRPDPIPLSFAQRRLWFLNRFDEQGAAYNIPLVVRLTGQVDVTALRAAVTDVVGRHEVLRTVFAETDGVVGQVVRDVAEFEGLRVAEGEVTAFVSRGFDISAELPVRAGLFAVRPGVQVLALVVHHIAADGWSAGILARDLATAYAARVAGHAPAWEPLPVHYVDYTLWQAERLGSELDSASVLSRQTAYWREKLAGVPGELALPVDRPRGAGTSDAGGVVEFRIEKDLHAGLAALARSAGVSVFMVLQAGLSALLTRLGAGTDIPIGSPVAGRADSALDDLVGFFVNTLVLRMDTSGDPSFRQLLDRARAVNLGAYANQDVPFERLVEVLNPERSLSRHPLFQVMLTLQHNAIADLELPGVTATAEIVPTGSVKFDLAFTLSEQLDPAGNPLGIRGFAGYRTDLFDEDTISSMTGRLLRLLADVVADPGITVRGLDVLEPAERDLDVQVPDGELDVPVSTGPIRFYVLNQDLQPTPAGVRGELYAAGQFGDVSHELRDVPLVADPFVADPLATALMYRIRRLGVRRRDGRVEIVPEQAERTAAAAPKRVARTAVEHMLCEIFSEVLGRTVSSVDDDFFALGGHSLLATRLVSRVRSVLRTELTVRLVFEAPTVAMLAGRLAVRDSAEVVELVRRPRPDIVPLSSGQRRLWVLNRLDTASPAYNIPLVARLVGELDVDALRAAVVDVVDRHEVLRTVFVETSGAVGQVVRDVAEFEGLRVLDGDVAEFVSRGFDVSAELPVRAGLFAVRPGVRVLALVVHHIASDGWSSGLLARDLGAAYTARAAGRAPDWEPLPLQYVDYVLWQAERLGNEFDPGSLSARQLSYWQSALAGVPDELALPVDRPRGPNSSAAGDVVEFTVDGTLLGGITELGLHCGASVFMVLQAGLAALLTRLGAGTDIPIGSPVAGRTDAALDDLVGFFVNTLVFRTDTAGDPSFRELLGRVRETNLGAYANQDVPFERLVEVLSPQRSLSRHPLFQVMLTLQNNAMPELDLPGVSASGEVVPTGAVKFDLAFTLSEDKDGLRGIVEYRSALFDEQTVHDIVDRYLRLLFDVVADPDRTVGSLDVPWTQRETYVAEQAPATRADVLTGLFTDLFGVPVAAEDEFRILGGDSMLAVDLAGRALRAGIQLSVADVLTHQSPGQLASVANDATEAGHRTDTGPVPLMPAVARVRERGDAVQSVDIPTPAGIDHETVRQAVQAVVDHHDALRLRVDRGPTWVLDVAAVGDVPVRIERMDDEPATQPLRALWIDAGPQRQGKLRLTADELVADEFSWRILLDDLTVALRRETLPPVGKSLRDWAKDLADRATHADTVRQLPFWLDMVKDGRPAHTGGGTRELTTTFTPVPAELQIAGLVRTLDRTVVIGIAEAGRAMGELSRTVGPLSHRVPVRFDDPTRVGEALAAVPGDGAGYALLRYLNPQTSALLAARPSAEIGFTALGDRGAHLPHRRGSLDHAIELTTAGRTARWSWCPESLTGEEVTELATRWRREVELLAGTAIAPRQGR